MYVRRSHARARGLVDDGRDGSLSFGICASSFGENVRDSLSVDRFDEKCHEFAGVEICVGRLAIETSEDGQRCDRLAYNSRGARATETARSERTRPPARVAKNQSGRTCLR